MRTLFMLVLVGCVQQIRAQENAQSSITNSTEAVTHPRTIKALTNGATDLTRQTVSKDQRAENAKHAAVILSHGEKAQSFGAYDRPVIAEVEKHWRELLNNIKHDAYSTGKVVLQFQLQADGGVTELKLIESTVGDEILVACQQAVLDSSPFPRWPKEMHKQIAADTRRLTLTFHYPSNDTNRKKQ